MTLIILTYLSILIFLAVMIYRVARIAATPAHLRWELYPVPHEKGKKAKYGGSYLEESEWWTKETSGSKIGELNVMIPEIFFLKGVWESNRALWFWSWAFHSGLYLTIFLAVLVIASVIIGPVTAVGSILSTIAGIVGIVGFFLGALGCLGVLYLRLFNEKIKIFTVTSTIFNLLFIMAIFVTGIYAVASLAGTGYYIGQLQQLAHGLIGFKAAAPIDGAVAINVIFALLFMIYMPFTHMAHMILKYFTYHSIRWNDQPNLRGSKMEKKIGEALHFKPTWAAKHINADGKKTWADIATEEMKKDE